MPRAAIYSRFSSDLQRDRSVEDQIALCRDYAARNGLTVVASYDDRARSGSSLINRDGIMRLLDAAKDRQFDVLIVEALDRISRDQEDLAGVFKRLTFAGIKIQAVHDGLADQVQVGIRGLVGALYLQDLAHKTRRGMAGVIRDGRHAGGRAYGYRAVPGKPGELEIVEHEAVVVRRIVADYVAGKSARAIAGELNAERVPPPRGDRWAAVTINGNRKRGNGILANPLYDGVLVWNRVRMLKDPDSGKRISRPNVEMDWQTAAAEHLRIVDHELFARAGRMKELAGGEQLQDRRRPKHLLSGLLRCAACGGGMSVKDRDHGRVRLQCTTMKESGTCAVRHAFYADGIERSAVDGLREHLRDRTLMDVYVRAYNAERKRLAAEASGSRGKIEARLAAAERAYDRAYQGYVRGFISEDEAAVTIPALRAERDGVRDELALCEAAPTVLRLHPNFVASYLDAIDQLEQEMELGAANGPGLSRMAFRELVERVTVHAPSAERGVWINVDGRLAALAAIGAASNATRVGGIGGSGRGTRTPDTRIMIPLL